MKRIAHDLDKMNWGKKAYALFALCAITAAALPAQTFTTLHSFAGGPADGAVPYAGLVQATNGYLYGTTVGGGANGSGGVNGGGTIFKITPSGTLTTFYSFCAQSGCTDGAYPQAGIIQTTNGNLYGTTAGGGATDEGTAFKIAANGTLTTLYSFCSQGGTLCTDGADPQAGLVQATNGNFYGTTASGGANDEAVCSSVTSLAGCGTVFKITPTGTLTTLYSFCSQGGTLCTDGAYPIGGLVQGADGNLYGTTPVGGRNGGCYIDGGNGCGTVFKITPAGTLTTLYSFCSQSACADGGNPGTGLVQATNGELYGTTYVGGAYGSGTVFKITQSGTLKTLHSFCAHNTQNGCTDGHDPVALVQASDGNFYGTTTYGGASDTCNSGCGTVFKMTPTGKLTTLYSFEGGGCPESCYVLPVGLVQDTNGTFYGTTRSGSVFGSVFSLSVGLNPFVETRPTSRKVGAVVEILGTNLTGATSVTFNGTAAVFKVVSSSEITTTVPTGATTGKVEVVTPGGTLSSNAPFRVP
jgi:uncharacterized repeat protein (TIGR03803 family)